MKSLWLMLIVLGLVGNGLLIFSFVCHESVITALLSQGVSIVVGVCIHIFYNQIHEKT